jgi:UDP-N-acetyl-D-mannosaminuronic acid transferase (WecB/TagA/CpsF family)
MQQGGLLVVPAAPALKNLPFDREYRNALLNSDLAITDSGFMLLLWNFLHRDSIRRLSGLEYMRELIKRAGFRRRGEVFWVMASIEGAVSSIAWLETQGIHLGEDDYYVAPAYNFRIEDREILGQSREQRPKHVIVTLGGGIQERLGFYLKSNLDYAVAVHCTGAAISFVSGDQDHIPPWADRFYLGWLFRCGAEPRRYGPRYWSARHLVPLMVRHRDRMPELHASASNRPAA